MPTTQPRRGTYQEQVGKLLQAKPLEELTVEFIATELDLETIQAQRAVYALTNRPGYWKDRIEILTQGKLWRFHPDRIQRQLELPADLPPAPAAPQSVPILFRTKSGAVIVEHPESGVPCKLVEVEL